MSSGPFLWALKRNEDGAVAVVFGLSLMALLTAAGIAMDYSRAFSIQSALQSDLDAAVLGAATHMGASDDPQLAANTYFNDNWKAKHRVDSVSVALSIDPGVSLTGTATATIPTTLMHIAGFDSVTVQATSQVEIAAQHVEGMLVLDTTGSMAGAKLTALKAAANELLDTAFSVSRAAEIVKIGVVPFAQYVNVGTSKRGASWLSVDNDHSVTTDNVCYNTYPNATSSNCHTEHMTGYNDGVPYPYDTTVCDWDYGTPVEVCGPQTNTFTWNGCVGSRNNPLDTLDEQYSTPVPGVMNATCGSEIVPLSNDKSALSDQIDSLIATGDTYIPSGLMWGWAALSSHAPYDEATAYGVKVDGMPVKKVLVLMTDGQNTISPTYPAHDGSDQTQANTLTETLCDHVKASGIEVHTVAFAVTDEATKDLLRACASSSSKYYEADDSAALSDAFRNIAKDFTPLRLAR